MIPFTSNTVLFREITFISSFFITLMPAPAIHPLISAAKHQFLIEQMPFDDAMGTIYK